MAVVAEETIGWSYHRDRDLTGFIDGTENPTLVEAPGLVYVPDGAPGAGGSVLLLQKWEHRPHRPGHLRPHLPAQHPLPRPPRTVGPVTAPPALLFDLDGTLIDSVYQHVLAWQEALTAFDVDLAVWKIHRRIGMSGGLFVHALVRETGGALSPEQARDLGLAHAEAFGRRRDTVRALPGARDLLATLTAEGVPWAIATSGLALSARPALALLGLPEDTPLVTRDQVRHAKPDPDLFLAAADLIDVAIGHAIVVGDSIWDLLAARRAGALGVGLLSGGYGREELERAGAYRVYADPADLLDHLDEIGVRRD